jgi:hypothetical protein
MASRIEIRSLNTPDMKPALQLESETKWTVTALLKLQILKSIRVEGEKAYACLKCLRYSSLKF